MTLKMPSSVSDGVRPMISRTLPYSSAERPNSRASSWLTAGAERAASDMGGYGDSLALPYSGADRTSLRYQRMRRVDVEYRSMDTGQVDVLSRHPVPRHRLTVNDYHRLGEAGIL